MHLKISKITKKTDYKALLHTSHKIVSKHFVIIYTVRSRKSDYEIGFKYGITVSKKVGNAVKRNLCKRLIRVIIKNVDLRDLKDDLSLNIIARKSILSTNSKKLQNDLNSNIKKIIFYKKSFTKIINMFFFVLLLIYQKFISLFMNSTCRYYPSCSNFARTAFRQFGLSGISLILKRILKCHPFNSGGYDPVPIKLIKIEEYD